MNRRHFLSAIAAALVATASVTRLGETKLADVRYGALGDAEGLEDVWINAEGNGVWDDTAAVQRAYNTLLARHSGQPTPNTLSV